VREAAFDDPPASSAAAEAPLGFGSPENTKHLLKWKASILACGTAATGSNLNQCQRMLSSRRLWKNSPPFDADQIANR